MSFPPKSASGNTKAKRHRVNEVLDLDRGSMLVELTTSIVSACVREPDQVQVSYDPRKDRLLIAVATKDKGTLIGRGGKNLRALEDALSLAYQYQSAFKDTASAVVPFIELVSHRDTNS